MTCPVLLSWTTRLVLIVATQVRLYLYFSKHQVPHLVLLMEV